MNGAIREMWKAALLSGEYEQGMGALRDSRNRFCCLGVLCDLYHKTTGKGLWRPNNVGYIFVDTNEFDLSSAFITHGVRKWAGFNDTAPAVPFPYSVRPIRLTAINDHLKKTFPEIAELLDQL